MKPREWVIRHVSLPEARFEARWEIEPGAYETPLRNDERLTVREVLPATECESLDANVWQRLWQTPVFPNGQM